MPSHVLPTALLSYTRPPWHVEGIRRKEGDGPIHDSCSLEISVRQVIQRGYLLLAILRPHALRATPSIDWRKTGGGLVLKVTAAR